MKRLLALAFLAPILALSASLQVTWDPHPDGTNIAYFNVYVTGQGGSVEVTPATLPPVTLTNLNSGVVYKIEATAVNRAGLESEFSSPPIFYSVPSLLTPGPVTSSGFLFSGVGKFAAQFTWPQVAVTNIIGYRVKWGPTTNKLNTINVVGNSVSMPGLTNGVNYYMSVEALDKNGNKSNPSQDYVFRNDFAIVQNVRTTLQTFTSPSQVP